MNKSQAKAVLEHVATLFPTDTMTDEITALWIERLLAFKYTEALAALKRYKANEIYPTPNLAAYLHYMDHQPLPPAGKLKYADGGLSGFFVQCVERPSGSRGKLGRYVPVLYGTSRNIPPDHVVRRDAERMRAAHEALYGGRWVVIEAQDDVDDEGAVILRGWGKMQRSASRLQAQAQASKRDMQMEAMPFEL